MTAVNPKAKVADVFLPAFVAGVSKHAPEDSEVAHPHALPRDGPGSRLAVLLRGCWSCSTAGPKGQDWLSGLQRGQSSFPTGRRVPAPHQDSTDVTRLSPSSRRAGGTLHTIPADSHERSCRTGAAAQGDLEEPASPCHARDSQQLLRELRELQGGWWEQQDVPTQERSTDPSSASRCTPRFQQGGSAPISARSHTCVALCHCVPRELGNDWRHTHKSICGAAAIVLGYRGERSLQGGTRSFMTPTATDGTSDCAPITTRHEPSFGKMV